MENVTPTPKHEVTAQKEVERTHNCPAYIPDTDIYENKDSIVVVADMPGVDESSVAIHLEKSILTIRGNVLPTAPDGYRLIYSEYGPGVYERSFSVSDDIDTEKIEASLKNGVLNLTLRKSEQSQPKKIAIKVEK